MAELTGGAGRSARADAQRLRAEPSDPEFTLRLGSARMERSQAAAEAARVRRSIPHASPWSGLQWLSDDEALHTVLVPVDEP